MTEQINPNPQIKEEQAVHTGAAAGETEAETESSLPGNETQLAQGGEAAVAVSGVAKTAAERLALRAAAMERDPEGTGAQLPMRVGMGHSRVVVSPNPKSKYGEIVSSGGKRRHIPPGLK